jgi:hypothetical protein
VKNTCVGRYMWTTHNERSFEELFKTKCFSEREFMVTEAAELFK